MLLFRFLVENEKTPSWGDDDYRTLFEFPLLRAPSGVTGAGVIPYATHAALVFFLG